MTNTGLSNSTPLLVLMRHGESIWNREGRLTGRVDVPLTEEGRREAAAAAGRFPRLQIDVAYCSPLSRARETAGLFLAALGCGTVPLIPEPLLLEKHYGILQGLNKERVRERYGDETYHLWHRSWEIGPPNGESLQEVADRVYPFFFQVVEEDLRLGKRVLLVAHGNLIRTLIKLVEKLSPEEVEEVAVATATPLVYQLTAAGWVRKVE